MASLASSCPPFEFPQIPGSREPSPFHSDRWQSGDQTATSAKGFAANSIPLSHHEAALVEVLDSRRHERLTLPRSPAPQGLVLTPPDLAGPARDSCCLDCLCAMYCSSSAVGMSGQGSHKGQEKGVALAGRPSEGDPAAAATDSGEDGLAAAAWLPCCIAARQSHSEHSTAHAVVVSDAQLAHSTAWAAPETPSHSMNVDSVHIQSSPLDCSPPGAGRSSNLDATACSGTPLDERTTVFRDQGTLKLVVSPRPSELYCLMLWLCPLAISGAAMLTTVLLVPRLPAAAVLVLAIASFLTLLPSLCLAASLLLALPEAMRETVTITRSDYAIHWSLWGLPVYNKHGKSGLFRVHLFRRVTEGSRLLFSAGVLTSRSGARHWICGRLSEHVQRRVLGLIAEFLHITIGPDEVEVQKRKNNGGSGGGGGDGGFGGSGCGGGGDGGGGG